MTEPGGISSKHGEAASRVLRAKYLDYCSARVTDVLLRLTADDMYLLAQEVAAGMESGQDEVPSFNTMVRLATERITRDLALPDYSDWVIEYEKDPERFEREMIGLWETELKTSNPAVN